jgi:hypothetical protein
MRVAHFAHGKSVCRRDFGRMRITFNDSLNGK